MRWHIPRLLACALALVLAQPEPALALDPKKAISQYIHRTWGAEDGLPQMSVLDILQSRDGYIWVGTQEGIARFDGARFTVFDKSNTAAMLNEAFTSVAQTGDGSLWFGTEIGGLLKYSRGEFDRLTVQDGLGSNRIRDLLVDADDTLWIATNEGLSRYRGGAIETYGTDDGLPHAAVEALSAGADGLWLGTLGGVARLRGERFEPVEIPSLGPGTAISALIESADGTLWVGTNGQGLVAFEDGRSVGYHAGDGLGDDRVEALIEDPDGALWIGTVTGGLVRFAGDEFSSFTEDQGLGNNWVGALAFDREGNLWIGTLGGGLSSVGEGKLTPFGPPEGLSGTDVWSVFEDCQGAIWIGTDVGLNRFEAGRRTPFYGEELFEKKMVISALEDSSGRLWFGTRTAGLWRFDGSEWRGFTGDDCLPDIRAGGLTERDDGSIWLGTPSGLVRIRGDQCTTFDRQHGLPIESIRFAFEDRRGVLWLGTFGAGVVRYDDSAFTELEVAGGITEDQKVVLSYLEDRKGTLWFGTTGGLLRVTEDGAARSFTKADGLHDHAVICILDDDRGNLWISSNHGIYRVSKQELDQLARGGASRVHSTAFDTSDGMRASECAGGVPPSCWETADGRLWFGTIEGAAIVDPDRMPRNELPPPVVIESVLFDRETAPAAGELVAAPGTRKFEFRYTALSFVASEDLPFRYMLEGFDSDWVEAGTRRVAYYTSIPPGDYTFRVIAANADGVWNERGAAVSFTLEPLFHQTIAFRVLLGLALVLLGLAVAGLRIGRLRRREKQLMAAVESRTGDLRALTEELRELSLKDPLTGLRNRRFLFETVNDLFESLASQRRALAAIGAERRSGSGRDVFALFMVDIDHFKQVNDTWGHDAGDRVLVQLAEVLRGCIRADDVLVRWGGEEFLVVLPRTDLGFPQQLAERLRTRIAETSFDLQSGETIRKTCSVGFATYPFFERGSVDVGLEQLIALADLALLRAKESGRDRSLRALPGDLALASREELHGLVTDLSAAAEAGRIRIEPVDLGEG